jgi:hypothetical protein
MSAFQSLSGEKLTLNKRHPTRWIYEYTSRWLRPQGDRVDRAGVEFGKKEGPSRAGSQVRASNHITSRYQGAIRHLPDGLARLRKGPSPCGI